MYTFTLTLCALIIIGAAGLFITEKILDRFVFEPIEEDIDQMGVE